MYACMSLLWLCTLSPIPALFMKSNNFFKWLLASFVAALVLIMSFWSSSDIGSQMMQLFPSAIVTKDNHISQLTPPSPTTGRNIFAIYTGRLKFMRIQLPHVYRELRSIGGILDEVWFMMIESDNTTISKLRKFVQVANKLQGRKIFNMHERKTNLEEDYAYTYYKFFSHLNKFPNDRFSKFDDDVVYIRPRAFNHVVNTKDSSRCFMHFFNIAGSNWRCSWLHQKNGVYNDTNPKNLQFEFSPSAACGWICQDYAELTIRTFLHHYKKHQLDKYYFKDMELTPDRSRFSINAFLFDKDLIDIKSMLEVGKIPHDDEKWWTVDYSAKVRHPNCIIGEALVVHFAYRVVGEKMLSLNLLKEFSNIVNDNKNSFNVKELLWKVLEFT